MGRTRLRWVIFCEDLAEKLDNWTARTCRQMGDPVSAGLLARREQRRAARAARAART